MSRNLTASDRSSLIRLASGLPVGSSERKAILAGLAQTKTASSNVVAYNLPGVHILGDAKVTGNAKVSDKAKVYGNARISGNAVILGGSWDGSEGEILSGIWSGPGIPGLIPSPF